jgi:putative proteasome-type protease
MTYCLGIKLKSGLLGIADTRLTSGTEFSNGKKLFVHGKHKHSLFIMTSGLRSVRDKAITYFQEILDSDTVHYNKLYKAVNGFAEQLKRVAQEDKEYLSQSGLKFNLHAIIGGQLEDDEEHKLFLLYPECNWVEVGEGSPFVIIGNSGYGKPLLNRALKYDSSLAFALKTGFLSFDSTRVSANDVDFPIDVVRYEKDSFVLKEHRLEKKDVSDVSLFWQKKLRETIDEIPDKWMEKIIE